MLDSKVRKAYSVPVIGLIGPVAIGAYSLFTFGD